MKSDSGSVPPKPVSRAVLRDVEAGSTVDCTLCRERVRFQAKLRNRQVICNVYNDGNWIKVEHYHEQCYDDAGHPHGEPEVGRTSRVRERLAARASA